MAKKTSKKSPSFDDENVDDEKDNLATENETVETEKPKEQEDGLPEMKTLDFLETKKQEIKNTMYRKRYDALLLEMQDNLIDTNPSQTATGSASNFRWSFATTYNNGNINVFPMLRNDTTDNITKIPNAKEPVAFTKILIAAATLGGKVPDANFDSNNKVFARCMYEMWKRTWENPFANGENTLSIVYQTLLGTGCAAWRTYPREVKIPTKGTYKVKFDDIYREPMDMYRTWFGVSVNNFDGFSRGEVYYEKDIPKADFKTMYPDADVEDIVKNANTSQEAKDQKNEQVQSFVTVSYYENEMTNRYIVAAGSYLIFDGELPSDELFGHVEWANCFMRNQNDPYGVGVYELCRGNAAMNDYISTMTAIEIESEIYPLIFGRNSGNADMKYRRGPFVINPKVQGDELQVVKTSANPQQGIMFADRQKNIMSSNSGVTDILAGEGGDSTLGGTVIQKEAALQRLTLPRNSVVRGLERDAYKTVSWILQTYSVRRVETFDTDKEFNSFIKANPGLFIERAERTSRKTGKKKIFAKYSQNMRLGFDFDENNPKKLIDRPEGINISKYAVLDELKKNGNISNSLLIKVDPNSMLIPSDEINKQQTLELYNLISAKTGLIFQAIQGSAQAPQSLELARVLYAQVKQVLIAYKQDVNKWFPKDITDVLDSTEMKGLPGTQAGQPPAPPGGAPGGAPGGGPGAPATPPGPALPQMENMPAPVSPMGKAMKKSAPTQGSRPGNPIRDAVYASIGRASSGPRTNFLTGNQAAGGR